MAETELTVPRIDTLTEQSVVHVDSVSADEVLKTHTSNTDKRVDYVCGINEKVTRASCQVHRSQGELLLPTCVTHLLTCARSVPRPDLALR